MDACVLSLVSSLWCAYNVKSSTNCNEVLFLAKMHRHFKEYQLFYLSIEPMPFTDSTHMREKKILKFILLEVVTFNAIDYYYC